MSHDLQVSLKWRVAGSSPVADNFSEVFWSWGGHLSSTAEVPFGKGRNPFRGTFTHTEL